MHSQHMATQLILNSFCGDFYPKDLHELAGNGMAMRCVLVAIAVALRCVSTHKVKQYINT